MLRVLGSVFLGAETQPSQRLTAIKGGWKHAWQLCHEEVRTICSTRYAAVISAVRNLKHCPTSNSADSAKIELTHTTHKGSGFFF